MRLNDDELNIIEQINSKDEIIYAIKQFGYIHKAGGSYSEVYTRGESAIKVNVSNPWDDGALLYLEWLRDARPDNPAFPHVYHVWRKYRDDKLTTYVAEMEALETNSEWSDETTDKLRGVIHGRYKDQLGTPELQAANIIRERFLDIASFDMHAANWMLRGTQPVITDPLAFIRL